MDTTMPGLWPWLAVAGLGALHGLAPANGWMFAAACGVRAGDSTQVRRALVPIAIGHAASVALVACVVTRGILVDGAGLGGWGGALLLAMAACRLLLHKAAPGPAMRAFIGTHAGDAGIALWSCLMATAHGAGMMLVPALVPLCASGGAVRAITASGSLVMALAAVAIHLCAMLATTAAIANGVCRGIALLPRLPEGAALRHAWTAALAATGVLLVVLR